MNLKSSTPQAERLFAWSRSTCLRQTDRLFAGLMIFQWLSGIAAALWLVPRATEGNLSETHPHLWFALFLGAALAAGPVALALLRPGERKTRHTIALTQMFFVSLLLQMIGGHIGAHFFFFGSLALLSFYRDWKILVTASIAALTAHEITPLIVPPSVVPSVIDPTPWWEHTGWIVIVNIFLARFCLQGIREMKQAATHQAKIELNNEQKYEGLVNSMDAIVWEGASRTGPFTFVSRQAETLLGYPASHWISHPGLWMSRIHDEDRDCVLTLSDKEIGAGRPHELEYRMIASNGRIIWVRDAVTLTPGPDGTPVCRGVITDITERKRIDHMKTAFISMVSHELRTPLTSVQGSLGLLYNGIAGTLPSTAHALVEVANRNTKRMLKIVNDILELNRMAEGKMKVTPNTLEIMPLIRQAIESNRAYAGRYGIRLVLDRSLERARVNADPDRIVQVLTNLISNATKFSPNGGSVHVSCRRHADSVRVAVRDHGPGIPEEFQNRIFQRFAQACSNDTRHRKGSGLGLSIAKNIVELHGGTIGFETEAGVGTLFYFDLPEKGRAAEPHALPSEVNTKCVFAT